MIANKIATSSVPMTRTLRATPGVDPARASVVVSLMGASPCCGLTITLSSRNHCSQGQRVRRKPVPTAQLLAGGYRRGVEEQGLGDCRLHRGPLERLGDQEGGFGPGTGEQPLRESRN